MSQNITSQHALTKEEVKQMQGNKDTYGHNHDNNEQKMKELMEQRKQERKSFNINDFNTDPNMDGFGILNLVGVTVDTLHIENKDTIDKHYEYLLENRKKNSQ